ncbi:bifunctional 2-keto-4-hydroxyglutarate aldolase/2-keto-3-deoxy-6-phosphogluconate aldolase [Bacillus tianshenii]|nr:bifunctional 2-keto-4-hydroxyglutarate aldolase/2-keto-3-deoxy-6-phosphogluconate aldolase [Bacillus tianshenii]
MKKEEVLQIVRDNKLVAIIRANSEGEAIEVAKACISGGIRIIEITFTVQGAQKVIETLVNEYKDQGIIIGAGSVLDSETARIAMLAGATFIVSPYLDEGTAKLCNRYRVPYMPGIMTVKDAVQALELGADILKLFPGDAFTPGMIKAIKGPLPQAELMPTGGVNLENMNDWLEAGASAIGLGSSLIKMSQEGKYTEVSDKARQLCAKV